MIFTKLYDKYIRLGNLIYYLAYQYTLYPNENEITIVTNNLAINLLQKLINNINILQSCNRNIMYNKFDEILDSSLYGFKTIKQNLNYAYLNSIIYNFDISNSCVINIRLGDYLSDRNNHIYKVLSNEVLENILCEYCSIINSNYTNVIIISDNVEKAREKYSNIISSYINIPIIYYHSNPIYDFNLLINAKFIIGSCSTFSFAGGVLNKYDAKMIVEYPYYKKNNKYNWKETKQSELYNYKNIIKYEHK